MRAWLIAILFVMCVVPDVGAQRIRGATRQGHVMDGGEEVLQVDILSVPVFSRPIDMRRYQKLVAAVKKVYPLAQTAKTMMRDMEDTLLTMSKAEQNKYIKQCYKQVLDEYTPVVKRMTRTQGKVLVKLIDRETEYTAYGVIKEFRGGFVASFWQGIGKIFGQDLKAQYDKEVEDRVLEQIVVYYEAGLL